MPFYYIYGLIIAQYVNKNANHSPQLSDKGASFYFKIFENPIKVHHDLFEQYWKFYWDALPTSVEGLIRDSK